MAVVSGTLRRLLAVLASAVLIAASRVVLGVWPTSAALVAVGMWWGLRAWSRWEQRWGRPRAQASEVVRRPVPAAGHVAFARALATVAAAYLAECEQEAEGR
jgi:hypothetical protein